MKPQNVIQVCSYCLQGRAPVEEEKKCGWCDEPANGIYIYDLRKPAGKKRKGR